jgi:UPF0271 protein
MKEQKDPERKHILVMDTSAFLAGFDPFSFGQASITVPMVQGEIQKSSIVKTRFETAIESGKLEVQLPAEKFCQKIKAITCNVGDAFKLSDTDTQLLALAMQLKAQGYFPQVLTDDYSIQNVVKQMDMEFVTMATFGIKRLLMWITYCPACHKQYSANTKSKECLVCGTKLKRKPQKK